MVDSDATRRTMRQRVRTEVRLVVVVAGPNGAGKSTFVETFLEPTGILVVNPDDVARGLSPDTPEALAYEAARVADAWRRDLVARGVSFCMETVFSDPHGAKLDFLRECRSQGYTVVLIFIGLESADLSRGRIMERVEAGGHDVPDEKIDSRFPRTFTKGSSRNKCGISGRRGARIARREEGECRVHLTDEQRSEAGCVDGQNVTVIP